MIEALLFIFVVAVIIAYVIIMSIVGRVADIAQRSGFVGGAGVPRNYLSKSFLQRREDVQKNMSDTGKGLSTWHHVLTDYIITNNYSLVSYMYSLLWQSLNITDVDTTKNKPISVLKELPTYPPYSHESNLARFGFHIGQRKLFLNEVYFVSRRIPADKKSVVVYAGAAPANKGALLSTVTPNVTWVFVDPADFNIFTKDFPKISVKYAYPRPGGSSDKLITREDAFAAVTSIAENPADINIINSFMTDTVAQAIVQVFGAKSVYMISDIRTNMYGKVGRNGRGTPDTADLTLNNVWQYNWLRIIRPKYAMLKFRMPFFSEPPEFLEKCVKENAGDFAKAKGVLNGIPGIDFAELSRNKKMQYFAGDVVLQPWAPKSSTETRLETDCREITAYNVADYDTQLYLYNVAFRNIRCTVNENADLSIGFDMCNDCAFENMIWVAWLDKYRKIIEESKGALPDTVQKCVKMLIAATGERSLLIRDPRMPKFLYHGDLGAPLTIERFQGMLEYNAITYSMPHTSESRKMFSNDDE